MPENNQNIDATYEVNPSGKKVRITPGTTKILKIVWNLPDSKTVTWSVPNPKTTLTKTEVMNVAEEIVTKEIISVNGEVTLSVKETYITETTITELT